MRRKTITRRGVGHTLCLVTPGDIFEASRTAFAAIRLLLLVTVLTEDSLSYPAASLDGLWGCLSRGLRFDFGRL